MGQQKEDARQAGAYAPEVVGAITRGPWTVRDDAKDWAIIGPEPSWVTAVDKRNHNAEANAHLIAAAPDLLAALEAAVECGMVPTSRVSDGGATAHVKQVHVADQIRAAIAKARGQS